MKEPMNKAKRGEINKRTVKYIRTQIFNIMGEIRHEIDAQPQYPNIGKKGCLMRLQKLFNETLPNTKP